MNTKSLIISLIVIALILVGLGIFIGLPENYEKVPAIVLAQGESDYLYQTINTGGFEAKFGRKDKLEEIVFAKDGTQITIYVPIEEEQSEINWHIADDKLAIKDLNNLSEYSYSVLTDEQNDLPIGIKEEIILNQKPINMSFDFLIELKGLKPQNVGGLWRFFDKDGVEKFFIPKPFMDDALGAHSDDVGINIIKQGKYYLIEISPDTAWLADEKRSYPVIIDPTFETNDQPMEELKEQRTLKAKFFDNQDGTNSMKAFAGYIHYKDKQTGQFEDVDTTLWPTNDGWQMSSASYELDIPTYSDQWLKFTNSLQIDYASGQDLLVPDEVIELRPLNINKVKGQLSVDPSDIWHHKRVIYPQAYGQHIDLQLVAREDVFDKLVVINEKPADLSKDLEFSFEIIFPEGADIKTGQGTNTETWSGEEPLKASGTMLIIEKLRRTWFRNFKVWDSQGSEQDIEIKLEKKGDNYILTKYIDKEFLANAVYPVISDASPETYYTDCAGGDDIGYVQSTGTGISRWDDAHNAVTGSSVVTCAGANNYIRAYDIGGGTMISYIARAFVPIDTSGLPDGETITSATLHVYFNTVTDVSGDVTYNIVQTTQPSVTTLAVEDFDLCGAVHTPTVGATAADAVATAWTVWNLNATGLSWISKTSYTKLGIRDVQHDIGDAKPTLNPEENIAYFDDDGTANDPYIEITYGAATPDPPVPAAGTDVTKIKLKGGLKVKPGVKFK